MSTPAAGWYPNPDDSTQARYWDGAQWTDQTRPTRTEQPAPPPPPTTPAAPAAPAAVAAAPHTTAGIRPVIGGNQLADIGRRIGAWFIDVILYGIVGGTVMTVGVFLLGGFFGNRGALVAFLLTFAVTSAIGLYFAMDARTPGKWLLELQVVDKESGQPLDVVKYVLNRGLLGGLVNGLPIVGFFLTFMPLWDKPLQQSIFGKVSGSCVVQSPR